MIPDLSPAISVFVSVLVAVVGLYILRIPQAARILAQSFATLNRVQERKIETLIVEVAALRSLHEECEHRSDEQDRTIEKQGREISNLKRRAGL